MVWFLRRNNDSSVVESKEALKDAKKTLREVKARGAEVSEVSNALREIRERNHFAEQLEAIIERRRE